MRALSYANRLKEPAVPFGLDYVHWFREFFAEVVRVERRVRGGDSPDPAMVQQQLLSILNEQVEKRERALEHPAEELKRVRYIMVALTDEVLLKLDWGSGATWAPFLLEEAPPFETHAAGDRVFDELETILAGKKPASPELMSVYLLALALGLRGRYALSSRSATLESLRQQVMQRLYQSGPPLLPAELCPSARQRTWNETGMSELRNKRDALRPYWLSLSFIVLVVGSVVWWHWVVADVWWQQDAINAMSGAHDSSTSVGSSGL